LIRIEEELIAVVLEEPRNPIRVIHGGLGFTDTLAAVEA